MAVNAQWFEVDKDGLGKALAARGIEFAIGELVQNAWDADGVTAVQITLTPSPGKPEAVLTVKDDSPAGFADLKHAYRLFGGSTKAHDPTRRGKFDLGEKLVFALAKSALVTSTSGTIRFDASGRHHSRVKTDCGSYIKAVLPMTRSDLDRCQKFVGQLIPPASITTTFNGSVIAHRESVAIVETSLETQMADEDGKLRRHWRTCEVHVHQPAPGEPAMIYEMGLPIQETGDAWHYNVMQRVPVGFDRDSVTDYYLSLVRSAVANKLAARVDDPSATWVTSTLESSSVTVDAVKILVAKRFGEKAVAYDPTDTEAVAKATAAGFAVVSGGSLSAAAWESIRRADALPRAGRIFPSRPKPGDYEVVPESEYSDGQKTVVGYVRRLGQKLLGFDPDVQLIRQPAGVLTSWNSESKRISFNLSKLDGPEWWPVGAYTPVPVKMIELIIHEIGHEGPGCDNHLSAAYYDKLCELGAKMRNCGGMEYPQ